ncbi:carboxypeptidase S [Plectosphaerella cucumerina]|uniref:Carboxypeptidase S n=1 Tax=Plectosphaerella cucumerina TaxID=40658 RepID=A0A8K0TFE7_9PEZI|nr:carboxypeptidase S [Plectosphaerella cucumerina]
MDSRLASAEYRNASIARLAGAIRIPTVAYDGMGPVGEDPRWDVFDEFADYLRQTFPRVHAGLRLEKVNTHGLLYTWQGSDLALKPTVLMAHQDVVPVPESTLSQWEHPPFAGEFDGKAVWGRGALDCKNTLVASLEAIESLLEAGFRPRRTTVLSFGFDEEISGTKGAATLAPFLLRRYGKDGAALIIDEGAPILSVWGQHFALPGVSEKGYIDIEIIVRSAGGHSSMPPKHTSAGIASELITMIEGESFTPRLHEENPILDFLWCGAEHAPEFKTGLKYLLPRRGISGWLEDLKRVALPRLVGRVNQLAEYLMMTTQAVDVLDGGVKINALPERTRILINHRVNIGEDTQSVKDKVTRLAGKIAKKYNLSLHAFDDKPEEASSVTVRVEDQLLEPAPVSPTKLRPDGGATPWGVLAGTTRSMYGKKVVVAPGIMPANTDTRYFWDLTKHIFRYFPGWDPEFLGIEGIHTVGEKVSAVAHVRTVQWYSRFLRNMDEADMA